MAPPQAWHVPPIPLTAPMHRPPDWQLLPAQQAPPTAPQFLQVDGAFRGLSQPRPALQVPLLPPQQLWPSPPHGLQVRRPPPPPIPPSPAPPPAARPHSRPAPQDWPWQHCWPAVPHASQVAPPIIPPPPPPPPLPLPKLQMALGA